MLDIKKIINEEIMTTVANYPQFGERLRSIDEIGDASSQAYPYEYDNTSFNEVHYYFSTPEYDYDVQINNTDPRAGTWDLQFSPVGQSVEMVTNEGKQFKIMSTVLQIINEFIDKHTPNRLSFKPVKDKTKDDDNRRFNFYMTYIKQHMRNDYIVYKYGDYIVIERKIKIKSNIPKI
jgi:hypothetical protein